ncbi:MAG: Usg family protein [Pseudomonadota bacterium]
MAADTDFKRRLEGAQLTTAEVLYHLPDYPGLLQSFVWQTLDIAPRFPRLTQFLDHWRRDIDAMIHSVRVGHSGIVSPVELSHLDGEYRIN